MAKKFKDAAAAAKPVYRTIIGSQGPEDAHDTQDVQDTHDTPRAHRTHNTQVAQDVQAIPVASMLRGGRKQKQPRINMAFAEENLEYLRVMAGLEGMSVTGYVNRLVEEDRGRREETYREARRLAGKEKT